MQNKHQIFFCFFWTNLWGGEGVGVRRLVQKTNFCQFFWRLPLSSLHEIWVRQCLCTATSSLFKVTSFSFKLNETFDDMHLPRLLSFISNSMRLMIIMLMMMRAMIIVMEIMVITQNFLSYLCISNHHRHRVIMALSWPHCIFWLVSLVGKWLQ